MMTSWSAVEAAAAAIRRQCQRLTFSFEVRQLEPPSIGTTILDEADDFQDASNDDPTEAVAAVAAGSCRETWTK